MSQLAPSLVLVTGLAGAGHSTALKILEDEGYVSVDNLPMALVDQLVAIEVETNKHNLAICLDARTSGFDNAALLPLIENLKHKFSDEAKILYLTASRAELARRFQSTRRTHPLAKENVIEEAILIDQEGMSEIRTVSDVVVDTTAISPSALRQAVLSGLGIEQAAKMSVQVTSFAYQNGVPDNADYVFDVRFLRNPHWEPELRQKTGADEAVSAYVSADQGFDLFLSSLRQMSALILARALKDGRPQLQFAFGCTGGKHRSVATAIAFAQWVKQEGHMVTLQHRELVARKDSD